MTPTERLLAEVAKTVLRQLVGNGCWNTHKKESEDRTPKNPIHGLSAGDVVYSYNGDDMRIEEEAVAFVCSGVGYIWYADHRGLPRIEPVESETHFRSVRELLQSPIRSAILSDVEYLEKNLKARQELAKLLE